MAVKNGHGLFVNTGPNPRSDAAACASLCTLPTTFAPAPRHPAAATETPW